MLDCSGISMLESDIEHLPISLIGPTNQECLINPECSTILRSPCQTTTRQSTSTLIPSGYTETMAEGVTFPKVSLVTFDQDDIVTRKFNSLSLLHPRVMATVDASLTAKLLVGQLLSYPYMLISGHKLPPFIHPPCALGSYQNDCRDDAPHSCLPESLSICYGLLHMFYKRTPRNWRYVWDQIYAHQRYLRIEVCH